MQQRLPSLRDEPIAFAHRGAKANAPENTIESFRLALRLGANGIESDVWLTADKVPVLDHDGVVRRRGRKVGICDVESGSLPSHVPSVPEFLDACGNEFDFSVDVKDGAAAAPTVAAFAAAGFNPARLWLCHWDLRTVLGFRESLPGVRIVDSTRLARIKEGPERRFAALAAAGVDAVNMHHTDWNGGLGTLAHRFGLLAFAWDAQQTRVLDDLFRMGMDAVYSDHVDRMVDSYAAHAGHPPRR